jgi:hypothetical protein
LFVQYDAHWIDGQPAVKKYGSWSAEYHFSIEAVSTAGVDSIQHESFTVAFDAIPGDTIYVLYMVYNSGDSFGTSTGNGEVLWVFKDYLLANEALKRWQHACNFHGRQLRDGAQQFCAFHVDGGAWIRLNNPAYGYFERVTTIEVVPMILQSPVDDQQVVIYS